MQKAERTGRRAFGFLHGGVAPGCGTGNEGMAKK